MARHYRKKKRSSTPQHQESKYKMEKLLRLINAGFLLSISGTDNPFGTPAEGEGGGDGLNEEFAFDLPEDNGTRIKAARYAFKVIGLDKTIAKSSNNPMWVFTLVGLHGEAAGREFLIRCALTPAALWKLSETLAALNLGLPGSKVAFKKSDALGKVVWGDVVDSEWQGRKQSEIKTVTKMTADEETKALALAQQFAASGKTSDVPF